MIGKQKLINLATLDADGQAFKNELLEVYFEAKDAHNKRKLCEDLDYKYILTMDGENSDFLQAPLSLMSTSVPLVVESEWTPLYFKSWVPWLHYVPIKRDLSDLHDKIAWLKENDTKAKQIADNGRALYDMLYSYDNLLEDSISVFTKYASLMKYVPEAPGDKFIIEMPPRFRTTKTPYPGAGKNHAKKEEL